MANVFEEALASLHSGLDLEPTVVREIMRNILQGQADTEELKTFLLALKAKGESAEEVSALVAEMYEHCAPISIQERAVDTVGTGGDGAHTINISSTAAIIAAAAGARGNWLLLCTRFSSCHEACCTSTQRAWSSDGL